MFDTSGDEKLWGHLICKSQRAVMVQDREWSEDAHTVLGKHKLKESMNPRSELGLLAGHW